VRPTELEKLRAKLDDLLAEREALRLEMEEATKTGVVDLATAENFARRTHSLLMWVVHFTAEVRKVEGA
jgi:hypothetical protein